MRLVRIASTVLLLALGLAGVVYGVRNGQLAALLLGVGLMAAGGLLATLRPNGEQAPRTLQIVATAAICALAGASAGWFAASNSVSASTQTTECLKIKASVTKAFHDMSGPLPTPGSQARFVSALRLVTQHPDCYPAETVRQDQALLYGALR